eukprot:jgi/Orpsp1_1/1188610/evm.model.d7180000066081.1
MKFFYLISYLLLFCSLQWNTNQFYVAADNYIIPLPSRVNGDKKLYIGHALKDENFDIIEDIKYKYNLKKCKFINEKGKGKKINCKFTDIKNKSYEINLEVTNGPSCPLDKNTEITEAEFHAIKLNLNGTKTELKEVEMPLYLNPKNKISYIELYNSMYFDFWTKSGCHFRSHIYTK